MSLALSFNRDNTCCALRHTNTAGQESILSFSLAVATGQPTHRTYNLPFFTRTALLAASDLIPHPLTHYIWLQTVSRLPTPAMLSKGPANDSRSLSVPHRAVRPRPLPCFTCCLTTILPAPPPIAPVICPQSTTKSRPILITMHIRPDACDTEVQ